MIKGRYSVGLAGLCLLLLSAAGQAAMMDVASVQEKLDKSHAGWLAGDSWVNRLGRDQVKRMLGYPKKVRYGKELVFTARAGALGGTEAVDWRNKDGQNWVSPVLNQGNCGSCVAYATVGTLETQMNISRHMPWLNPRFSTDALFACGGGGCESGWYPDAAASFLKRKGVPDEACMPATMSATGQDASCSSLCSDSGARAQKISSFNTPSSREAVKAALRRGPLVTTLDVYDDFLLYRSGVYKHTTGGYAGGHAVSLIGFDDARQAWIIRNSWGGDWGEQGFAYVSYDDESGVGDETWALELPGVEGVASIRNLRDHDFLAGNVTLDAASTYEGTSGMTLHLSGPAGELSTLSCKSGSCPFQIATAQLADGRYEAYVQATHAKGTASSEKKYFYVVNHKPELKLTFQPQGFNPAKASGRIEFAIDAFSSSVPLQGFKLVARKDGAVVFTKEADMVLPKMTLGWRTPYVANGSYSVSLVGTIRAGDASYQVESNQLSVNIQN